jgi:hypothetical protein
MIIKHYKSTNFPPNKIKYLKKLCLPNGEMKHSVIPSINNNNINFNITVAYIDGVIVGWAFSDLNVVFDSNFGIFVEPSLRRKHIGKAIINSLIKLNNSLVVLPWDYNSLSFYKSFNSDKLKMFLDIDIKKVESVAYSKRGKQLVIESFA